MLALRQYPQGRANNKTKHPKKLSANCCVYAAIFGIVDCVEYRYMYEDGFSGFM